MGAFILFFAVLFGFLPGLGGVQSKARDTERKTDINNLHSQVEVYYAENGYYPTLTNINDATWRDNNMKGLDIEALKDPDGGLDPKLSAAPAKNIYSYNARTSDGRDCNNTTASCDTYILTATLSDGTTYTKSALN